jgi:hypothetical protein
VVREFGERMSSGVVGVNDCVLEIRSTVVEGS